MQRLDLLASREGGLLRLVQLIQLLKDLCSQSSCLPLSACKFPTCLISPARAAGDAETRERRENEPK